MIRGLYKAFQGNIMAIPGRAMAFFCLLLLCFVPLVTQEPYILLVLIFVNVFAIYAASWDVLAGFTGQFNMGQGALFAIAAYTAAILSRDLGWVPWATIPCGALVAMLAGFIIAIPSMRLRGTYFTLVSLTFPLILAGIVLVFVDFTGGEKGISGVSALCQSRVAAYYTTFIVMVASVLAMWKFTDARSSLIRTGLAFRAIQEDEISARCSGIDTTRYKLAAFGVSAFFAGISGGLYVHVMRVAGPMMLDLLWSFSPIIWTIFGGMGTIGGAVTGVFVLYPVMELLRVIPELRMFVYACLVVLIILFMPEGIVPWARDKIEKQCPRCKLINAMSRQECRACGAHLHTERKKLETVKD
ncbi:MAG: branched-chain amino acid ABC transporter permease [Dehalococcoidia bacterium]|nr:MAG: branched-chain amino acid ABC transporter permease [Dehalococcoidia bacterium]